MIYVVSSLERILYIGLSKCKLRVTLDLCVPWVTDLKV